MPSTLRASTLSIYIASIFMLGMLFCTPPCLAKNKNSFTLVGDIGQIAIPLSALVISLIKEDNTAGAQQLTKTYAATLAATFALKYTMNTNRPNGGKHSFPSGHAASAFAGATFVDIRYGYQYGVPFYLAALTVGASRINAKAHNIADIVGGFIVSFACGSIFTSKYKTQIHFDAVPVKKGLGLSVSVPM